jgi:ubiquinone/menaquinone biosynthesis C-methylase UbiE
MNLRKQDAKPEGAMGWLAGQVMAMSNRERSEWVILMLDLKPQDRVLEIGFGPGADIARAGKQAAFIAGVDHSEVMMKQASKRNASAIREGRAELHHCSAAKLPFPDAQFEKAFAINTAQFWKDAVATLSEVHRVLKSGGWCALGVQPGQKGATEDHAYHAGRALAEAMTKAGYREVHTEMRKMKPVSTVCVLGQK